MKISDPGDIGNLTIKNRIVMAPMISNLANPDGSTNENHIAYLTARARGGAGLIITEYTYIDSINARGSRNQMGAYTTSFVPKLKRVTESIHANDGLAFMQLVHAGGKALRTENKAVPMAPSEKDYMGSIPREMTEDDIESTIRNFESAANIAKLAKFDGVEIHGAHGYLVHEYISPSLNTRNDRYGGSFEKRLTFPQMVIDAVSGIIENVGIRLSLYEDDPGGFQPDYGLKVAESLKDIDYVHFSAGNFNPPGSSASFYSNEAHIAERLPRKPDITTILVGSLIGKDSINKALQKADFVSIGRGMLADPAFAEKIISNPDLLRPCIRCNQGCRDLAFGEVRCTVNPSTGHERDLLPKFRGEVCIVGAGIQGLEAALYASKTGLHVILHESEPKIGGQINKITDPFKKKAFLPVLDYYKNALSKAGVTIKVNSRFQGEGIYCLPKKTYPDIPDSAERILSNIYQHHDRILELSEKSKITVGLKSLSSLDRARAQSFQKIASEKGITFTDDGEFDFSLLDSNQYDIYQAMIFGRNKVKKYISDHSNEFL